MGRKIKSFTSLALVALCVGVLIGVLAGASPAPGAPPPGTPASTTGTSTTTSTAPSPANAAPPVPSGCVGDTSTEGVTSTCPPAPTTPPPGVATTPASTTTGTSTTTSTITAPSPTSTAPAVVSTPVIGTVTNPAGPHPKSTKHLPTPPVNVIAPPATTSPASTPPITPVVTPTPAVSPPAAVVATGSPHARIHHQRPHKNRIGPVKPRKAIVTPPPPKPPRHLQPRLPAAVKVTSSVPTPAQVRFKAKDALLALVLAGFLVLLLAFPAEVFNKTYDENEEEIHLLLTRMGLRRHHLSRWMGFLVYALVGTALTVWLALAEGAKGNPLAVAVGLLVALPVVTFAFELPAELFLRTRSKIPGSLRVLPTALLVGAACAVISRAIHLEPAYLYGVFAGYAAVRADAIAEEDEGKSVLVGVATLALLAGVCWFAWGALDGQAHGDHRGWFVILVSTAFFWIFVLAAESLVFGLIPLKYLDGSLVRRWRTSAWLIPQLLAAGFFVYVIMLHGRTRHVSELSELIRPFCLFVGFGLMSFAFWGYFNWDGRPTAEHEKEATPAAAAAAAPAVAQPALMTAADALPARAADPRPPRRDG
ncbi:MAG: hypothetical protein M3071_19660 [Actinomycetota bacterium]|nr:hypothetical protein [Actinomycetota bacterium]